jgi:hypothetical protein
MLLCPFFSDIRTKSGDAFKFLRNQLLIALTKYSALLFIKRIYYANQFTMSVAAISIDIAKRNVLLFFHSSRRKEI